MNYTQVKNPDTKHKVFTPVYRTQLNHELFSQFVVGATLLVRLSSPEFSQGFFLQLYYKANFQTLGRERESAPLITNILRNKEFELTALDRTLMDRGDTIWQREAAEVH